MGVIHEIFKKKKALMKNTPTPHPPILASDMDGLAKEMNQRENNTSHLKQVDLGHEGTMGQNKAYFDARSKKSNERKGHWVLDRSKGVNEDSSKRDI